MVKNFIEVPKSSIEVPKTVADAKGLALVCVPAGDSMLSRAPTKSKPGRPAFAPYSATTLESLLPEVNFFSGSAGKDKVKRSSNGLWSSSRVEERVGSLQHL